MYVYMYIYVHVIHVYVYVHVYIFILTLSAFCINVKFILIIQGDIFLNLTIPQGTVTDKKCKKVYTN